jgi:magnesium chelatase family protein
VRLIRAENEGARGGTRVAIHRRMLASALAATLIGLDAHPVRVEVEAQRGVPFFELVGLAEAAVRESRVRVKSALAQVGVDLAEYRIIVNLSPADVRKAGSGFDLAIAAATLGALGCVPAESFEGVLLLGELSLDGSVQSIRGVLPQLLGARARGVRRAIVPRVNEGEAGAVDGIEVRTVATLGELVHALRGEHQPPLAVASSPLQASETGDDLRDVQGQASARRALEIAAAGGHNLLMIGPPGVGKTMLARRLPGIMPSLTSSEALDITAIHSVAGLLVSARGVARARPFRAPHHTVSEVGLVGGGGELPRPGEVSLAHHGVLFLDELAEFRRGALEALRQPLEDGVVAISRAHAKVTFPARPVVVCAMNPCACGYLGDGTGRCRCSRERIGVYRQRLSGPLLDRIDVHVALAPVSVSSLQTRAASESSLQVRQRVERARAVQRARFEAREACGATNATLAPRDLERIASLCESGSRLLAAAVAKLSLSARAYGKVLRVARTIADLDGATSIAAPHVAEAIGARVLDRGPALVSAA